MKLLITTPRVQLIKDLLTIPKGKEWRHSTMRGELVFRFDDNSNKSQAEILSWLQQKETRLKKSKSSTLNPKTKGEKS